jgi:hypothetical protein
MRILYNKNKWLDIYKDKKYEDIREKILNTFKGLSFIEEGHKYFLNGKEMECVSNVAHRFQEHIDTYKLATETYERNFNKSTSKYYQMTVEQIVDSWKKISDDACTTGTFHHEFGESCFYYMIGEYDKILPDFKDRLTEDGGFKAIYPKEESIVQFYEDIPRCIVPILTETRVYVEYENGGYAGTFDMLFYYDATLNGKSDKYSGLVIGDWKTNRDLYKNFKEQKLLSPFNELLDMPLSVYKLQLSLYENALHNIDLKVVARRILWLKSDGTYEKISLESYQKVIDDELKKIYNFKK